MKVTIYMKGGHTMTVHGAADVEFSPAGDLLVLAPAGEEPRHTAARRIVLGMAAGNWSSFETDDEAKL